MSLLRRHKPESTDAALYREDARRLEATLAHEQARYEQAQGSNRYDLDRVSRDDVRVLEAVEELRVRRMQNGWSERMKILLGARG